MSIDEAWDVVSHYAGWIKIATIDPPPHYHPRIIVRWVNLSNNTWWYRTSKKWVREKIPKISAGSSNEIINHLFTAFDVVREVMGYA
jgi:hypothetical protein